MNIWSPEFLALIASAMAFVLPIVELLKKVFSAQGIFAVILSGVVSIVIGAGVGLTQGLGLSSLFVYIIAVFMTANGWYKAVHSVKRL